MSALNRESHRRVAFFMSRREAMNKLYRDEDYKRTKAEEEDSALGRSPFRRDYGRLLHSPSFRRLQGKTQLFPGDESDFFRNRLTHSLEVAQVAKGIAQMLNATHPEFQASPIDLDLVEFAGLAHDLGHPPFGHNGEKALDDCMKPYGGFEGNAQTLRILARVEKKARENAANPQDVCGISTKGKDLRLGLNLTYRSLASILKYDRKIPTKRNKKAKLVKGYYATEEKLVQEIKKNVGHVPERNVPFKTIECQIMDIADDIAYSTYDLEDSMKGGFTHPLELADRMSDQDLVLRLTEKVKGEVPDVTKTEVFNSIVDMLPIDIDDDDPLLTYRQSKLVATDGRMRTEFSSEMVGACIQGVSAEVFSNQHLQFAKLNVERDVKIRIESLKHLNYLLTIMSPRLKVVEYRGYEVVETLFKTLSAEHELLPDDVQAMHRSLKKKSDKMRLVCDFVAGMTDRYAVEFYSRLKASGASIFKPL